MEIQHILNINKIDITELPISTQVEIGILEAYFNREFLIQDDESNASSHLRLPIERSDSYEEYLAANVYFPPMENQYIYID
jgi:hypothetical protein